MEETLILKRTTFEPDCTMGELYMPDGFLECRTLEDKVRNVKIPKQTAIPAGKYEVVVAWSNRYQRLMPRLLRVPFFEGILIHPGNDQTDTEGCILVGDDDPRTKSFLDNSRKAFDRLFPKLKKMTEKGKVYIDVQGGVERGFWVEVPEPKRDIPPAA